MIVQRRSFLSGLAASIVAAPAIVRASSLMPVRAIEIPQAPGSLHAVWLGPVAHPDMPSFKSFKTVLKACEAFAPGGPIFIDPWHTDEEDPTLPKYFVEKL